MSILRKIALLAFLALTSFSASAFDHDYREWNALLSKHVKVAPDGNSSRLDYRGMAADQARLEAWLNTVSAVPKTEYQRWPKAQRLAFLINAYNAWTIELVLSKYPDLKSIKDIGNVFQSPWKKKFIPLFGQDMALDDIEHGMIRASGVFDDPRIHAAVVCASIGCPMLRAEAFTADKLDSQLEDGMRRFLSDTGRNRFDAMSGKLLVSKILIGTARTLKKDTRDSDRSRQALVAMRRNSPRRRMRRNEFARATTNWSSLTMTGA